MKFGVTLGHEDEPVETTREYAREVEAAGLDMFGIPDSRFRETYATLAACALSTRTASLGPVVTNPVTRQPLTTLSSIATVDEIAGGERAFLGIGMGASGPATAGVGRGSVTELRDAVVAIRNARDGSSDSGVPGWWRRRLPILVAAGRGGRAARVAAEEADGVVIHSGASDPESARSMVAELTSWRREGSRAGEPFEVWLYSPGFVGSDGEARDALGAVVTGMATTIDLGAPTHGVPDALVPAVHEFQSRYSYEHHASFTHPVNQELMEELDLGDYFYGRFALVGDEGAFAERARRLDESGIAGIILSGAVPDKSSLIRRLGSARAEVMAA